MGMPDVSWNAIIKILVEAAVFPLPLSYFLDSSKIRLFRHSIVLDLSRIPGVVNFQSALQVFDFLRFTLVFLTFADLTIAPLDHFLRC